MSRTLRNEMYRKIVEEAGEVNYEAYDRFQIFILERKLRGAEPTDLQAVCKRLRKLTIGDHVFYQGYRGDIGYGIFLEFLRERDAQSVFAAGWGSAFQDSLRVQRAFSVGTQDFRPLVFGGDEIYAQEDFLKDDPHRR